MVRMRLPINLAGGTATIKTTRVSSCPANLYTICARIYIYILYDVSCIARTQFSATRPRFRSVINNLQRWTGGAVKRGLNSREDPPCYLSDTLFRTDFIPRLLLFKRLLHSFSNRLHFAGYRLRICDWKGWRAEFFNDSHVSSSVRGRLYLFRQIANLSRDNL